MKLLDVVDVVDVLVWCRESKKKNSKRSCVVSAGGDG